MICSYAAMDKEKLEGLKALEKELGSILLAFSCKEVTPAKLSSEQLEKIKNLEKELGMVIVAI